MISSLPLLLQLAPLSLRPDIIPRAPPRGSDLNHLHDVIVCMMISALRKRQTDEQTRADEETDRGSGRGCSSNAWLLFSACFRCRSILHVKCLSQMFALFSKFVWHVSYAHFLHAYIPYRYS